VSEIRRRKDAHLELCVEAEVESRRSTLLDQVHLLHEALPELSLHEVDLSVELFGRPLQAPVVISGMTGGSERAAALNRDLASAAQKLGLGMGVGSQRAMLADPSCAASFRVRDVAPDILLLANLGAVQARETGPDGVAGLVDAIGADALCVHLNAAQELTQDEGDRDFRGCLEALGRLARELPVPVVAKETGCGFAPGTLARLRDAGIATVDVAGAGGTSWPGVEGLRGSARQRALGAALREWGIPTAPAVLYARRAGLAAIASGGIRSPGDAIAALALGAGAVALALPFLRAHAARGLEGVIEAGRDLCEGLRALMLLTGTRRVRDLVRTPRVLGADLRCWLEPEPAA
jgi:isopentenyl-diphosphate delta-isomerase